ncbi:MAG TPA: hypothetical protein PLY70_11200 [Saprospiraceae bacterium]|nr:hypothetical protein [Saprospiraceae bacterium]HPN68645.1 hypothetical protein [Saprospiraceae bacterium]
MSTSITRYSDSELEEFRVLIEGKLEKAKSQYENLIEQIKEITENSTGDFTKDLSDFSSSQTEVELLNNMATRQRTYIQDLQNALIRIRNKTYGICVITGTMIEKRRLLAVPTTTKSVIAKQVGETPLNPTPNTSTRTLDSEDEDEEPKKKREVGPRKPVIITKVIKKPTATPAKSPKKIADDDDDDELDEILKDLDNFGEETTVEFDDDIDMVDDSADDFEDGFDDAADDGGEDDED